MKIIVIMGSPRKKDGYRICKQVEEALKLHTECDFEYIHLKEYKIEECKGCDQCFCKSEKLCPCRDDLAIVKAKMLQADGIIFASPVYAYHVPSGMKRFIDRLSYLFHRQELVGKPAITVTTTAGGGDKAVSSYMKMTVSGWGCRLAGELRIRSPLYFQNDNYSATAYSEKYYLSKKSELQKAAESFYQAMNSGKLPVPSFYDLYMFQGLRSKTFISTADYDYWKEKGWLEQLYFYKTKLGPIKYTYSIMLGKIIDAMYKSMG